MVREWSATRNGPLQADDIAKLREITDEFHRGPIWAHWRKETVRKLLGQKTR